MLLMSSCVEENAYVFEAAVDEWVTAAAADGVSSFRGFLPNLPGVYPTDVLSSLRRLVKSGRLAKGVFVDALAEISLPPARPFVQRQSDGLPLPHPLDFDWRFAERAKHLLLEELSCCIRASKS